ncbi:MAG: GIY-YIG nuclease family protein, partial [Bdellovibrionales bacterium]|nr:GIY-YIG nuclease family protein [Bdellovibrionales bacterium]
YKIGFSRSPEVRLQSLQTACPDRLQIITKFPGTKDTEKILHAFFEGQRVQNEWFVLSEDNVASICSPVWRRSIGIL